MSDTTLRSGGADLSLYLVTSSAMTGADRLVDVVLDAVAGGVTIVQLREPERPDREIVALGRDLADALRGTGVPLIIDDRVDLVETIGADGAHVGQSDLPADAARRILGPHALLGLSAHTPEQARVAADGGDVDHLGIGAAWDTTTKDVGRPPLGPEGVRAVAQASDLPSVAIGGIDLTRVPLLVGTGVQGVAVVSAICAAPDPRRAAADLRAAWGEGR